MVALAVVVGEFAYRTPQTGGGCQLQVTHRHIHAIRATILSGHCRKTQEGAKGLGLLRQLLPASASVARSEWLPT